MCRGRGVAGAGAGAGAAPAVALLLVCTLLPGWQVEGHGHEVNQNILDSLELPYLASGDSLMEGSYRLQMRQDCALLLHKRFPSVGLEAEVWSSRTEGAARDCFLHMQHDGNLVVSTVDGAVVWSSFSGRFERVAGARYFAILLKDGTFAVKSASGWSLWESGTAE